MPLCPTDTVLCIYELSDSISLTVNSNLPDLEYAIVDLNEPATNGSGPAIIGISTSSQFIPQDYGVDSNTTLEVFPIAYDKAVIQALLDDILKGSVFVPPIFNIPCCTFAGDLCMQLNDAGIMCGDDFTSLAQSFALFSADTTDRFSVQDFVDGIDSLNMVLADPSIPPDCGGGTEICYAYGSSCEFEVIRLEPFLSFALPAHTNDTTIVADTVYSSALVGAGLDVTYQFGIEALLQDGFETQGDGEFLAAPGGCD